MKTTSQTRPTGEPTPVDERVALGAASPLGARVEASSRGDAVETRRPLVRPGDSEAQCGALPTEILEVSAGLLERLFAAAASAEGVECMGVLASPAGTDVVTSARLLPVEASVSRAEAAPLAIARCARAFQVGGLVPRGIFHSHVGSVFHSRTDDETASRLLPAMAAWNLRAAASGPIAPFITSADEAALPLPDGQALVFSLRGPEVPGLDATESVDWTPVETSFESTEAKPTATMDGLCLRLQAGRVRIALGIPEGAVVCCRREPAPVRVARLYSLVVNSRGQAYAECVVVHDIGGETLNQRRACSVTVIPPDGAEPDDLAWGFPSLVGNAGGEPESTRPALGRRFLAKLVR